MTLQIGKELVTLFIIMDMSIQENLRWLIDMYPRIVGTLMQGLELIGILERVLGENAVKHMMGGKSAESISGAILWWKNA